MTSESATKPLFQIVEKWLQEEGFTFEVIEHTGEVSEPQTALRLPIQGQIGQWLCFVRILEVTERIVVYSVLPDLVEAAQRPRLFHLIAWINYGLILGNFEIDPSDGEIRYKTSIDVEDITVSDTLIRNLIFSNFFSMDRYWHALYDGMNTERTIESILDEVERSVSSDASDPLTIEDEHVH